MSQSLRSLNLPLSHRRMHHDSQGLGMDHHRQPNQRWKINTLAHQGHKSPGCALLLSRCRHQCRWKRPPTQCKNPSDPTPSEKDHCLSVAPLKTISPHPCKWGWGKLWDPSLKKGPSLPDPISDPSSVVHQSPSGRRNSSSVRASQSGLQMVNLCSGLFSTHASVVHGSVDLSQ